MKNSHDEHAEGKSRSLTRLEAFSDGVFAIAITLLILEVVQALHLDGHRQLSQLLWANWRSFLVFLIGFLTILICWINHHAVVSYAEKTDGNFFWINGFVLLVVTFTPFPTAILAQYLDSESHLALAIFGFNYFMMSLAAYCITAYILAKLAPKNTGKLLYYYKLLYKYSVFYTFVVFFVCFLSVAVAIFLYMILFFVFAFPKNSASGLMNMKSRKKHRSPAEVSVQQETLR
jgi:uncharacterized membrane protein